MWSLRCCGTHVAVVDAPAPPAGVCKHSIAAGSCQGHRLPASMAPPEDLAAYYKSLPAPVPLSAEDCECLEGRVTAKHSLDECINYLVAKHKANNS